MNIDKQQILDLLTSRGDEEKAARAQSELPDRVDTDRDAGLLGGLGIDLKDLLGGLGIDPQSLLGKLPGGLGGLGGLGR